MTHLNQIKHKLGISGISTSISSWRFKPEGNSMERGAQIDMVIDRGDHSINLCEMKFSQSRFTVTADYEQSVRNRIQLFREKTGTRKSLLCTFVTTFGVTNGAHSGVVDSEVVADDLFM